MRGARTEFVGEFGERSEGSAAERRSSAVRCTLRTMPMTGRVLPLCGFPLQFSFRREVVLTGAEPRVRKPLLEFRGVSG